MSGWEPERAEEQWSDRDGWRGELHLEGDEAWRGESLAVWGEDEEETSSESEEDDTTASFDDDWPENLAGPEYWLFKRDGM